MPHIEGDKKIELVKGGREIDGVFVPNKPKDTDISTINAASLVERPDFEIQDLPPTTLGVGEQARFETQTEQFTKGLEKQAETSATAERASFADFITAQLQAPSKTELEDVAFSREGGVDEIQRELDAINSELQAEQHSLERRIQAIEDKGGGLARGGEIAIENVRRESLRTQADLSIVQMAIQGRFDSAEAIANRAINIQLEQNQRRVDALGLVFQRNSNLFTQAEQRLFDTRQADRQREIDDERADATALSNAKLQSLRFATQNGAPVSILRAIQEATTPEDVLSAGGRFGAGKIPIGTGGVIEIPDKILTINQIEQFRRSFGWTPPLGFTQEQLTQYMSDNPDASPEELEEGARQFLGGDEGEIEPVSKFTPDEVVTFIRDNMTDTQLRILKRKSDAAGESSFFKNKKVDVKNYLNSIKDKIQEAIDLGFTQEEILEFLTS